MLPAMQMPPRPVPEWLESYRVSDYVRASARRWKLAALSAMAGLGLMWGWCELFPDSYVSYAQLLFLPPQVSEKYVESNVSLQADQRVSALTQMIGSHVTAGKMIQELGLYPLLRRWWPVADVVPYFRSDLSIKVINNSMTEGRRPVPTVQISFRYPDPVLAQKTVQRALETIYEENQRIRSNQTFRTTDFLQRQTKEVYEQLKDAERHLSDLNLADPSQRMQATALATEKLHEVHRRLYATQFDLRRSLNDRDLKRFQLNSLEERLKAVSGESISAVDGSWAGHIWRIKVSEARARLEETRKRYREGFPDREAAARELERLEAEMKNVVESDRQHNENQLRQRLVDESSRLRAELEGLNRNLVMLEKEQAALLEEEKVAVAGAKPNEQAQYQHLASIREHDLLKKRYEELLKKQRDSEVATEMERIGQGETIDLIEPPILPGAAVWPVRWMKLAAGMLAGLLIGMMVPLARLIHRPRIQSAYRLEPLLGIPLLAEVPVARLNAAPSALGRGRRVRLVISTHSLLLLLLTTALLLAGCARDSAPDLVARGIEQRKLGKAAEAGILFRRAIQIDKRCGEAYREMATLAIENSEVAAARQALIRAVELIPDDSGSRVKLAEITYRLYFADPGRPASLLREVVELAAQLTAQWPDLADGYRLTAQALLEQRRVREALAALEAGLKRMPGDAVLTSQLASALYQDGEGERAASVLRSLLATKTKYPPAYDLFYLQLMEAGRGAEAVEVLKAKWEALDTVESGLQWAAHLAAARRTEAAAALVDQIAARHSADPLAPLQIADFWTNRAEPERARLWLVKGREAHPGLAPRYAGRQIELLLSADRREDAARLLAAEIKANPDNQLLRAYREAIELDEPGADRLRQSRVRLEAILVQMPNSPFVRFHLGRAYLRDGDVVRAGEQFERCVTLDPNYAMGWLALADSHVRQGQFSRAAEEANFVAMRGASLPPVHLLAARAELGRNRPAAAERALNSLLQAEPNHPDGRLLMVQTKLALGQTAEARQWMKKLLDSGVDQPDTVAAAARFEAALGQPGNAWARLERAQARYPESDAVGETLAQLATKLGKYDAALDQYRRLELRHPAAFAYALGVANSLALLKKTSEAAEQFKRVQGMSGKDPRPWLNYAVMMAESGDVAQATLGYREALRRDPRHPLALNNLADLLVRHGGDLTEALNLAEQAGRLLPDAPEVIDTLAYAYLRKGLPGNAVANYRKLIDRLPKPERSRVQARIERIERGDLAGALSEASAPGFRM